MTPVPPGLPEPLPAQERLLWQGKPDWQVLARRTFHLFKLALYFGLLAAWVAVSSLLSGAAADEAALATLRALALGAVPLALVAAYAWIVARSTVYTITNRRLVLRVGVALPVTINLPFARIVRADLVRRADGSGDIALRLAGSDRIAYLMLWPHARPWRIARAEPMLRGLPDVQLAAQVLARGLAASAEMAVPVLQDKPGVPVAVPEATMAA